MFRQLLLAEGRLVWKGRWVLILAFVLLAVAVWGGPVRTYQYAVSRVQYVEELRSIYQSAFTEFVLDDAAAADLGEAVALLRPELGVNYLLAILAVLGPMVLPVWGAQLVGSEFKNRTAKVRAAHSGWMAVVAAKVLWLLLLSAGLALLFALAGAVSGPLTWRAAQEAIWLAGEVTPLPLKAPPALQLLVTVLGLLFYGLVGLLAALLTRSALAGALAGLALPYLEWMALGTPGWGWLLPRIAYGNLLADHFVYLSGGFVAEPLALVEPPSPLASWAVFGAWVALAVGLALAVSRRQQILS
ncbi:hypothetical protein [Symbiobacterium terraclitae]|uniref:hypothetical protein n=1 Tax=Symbiobacterium terraclitae TaxID=557451 RepID=UPI0035B51A82